MRTVASFLPGPGTVIRSTITLLIPKDLPIDNWFEISSHALAAKEVTEP